MGQQAAEPVWRLRTLLGEGPVWCDKSQTLWFTDIKGRQIHRFNPRSGERSSHAMPGEVGFLLPSADGSQLLGMGRALWRRHADGRIELLTELATAGHNRINDGTAGPDGIVWFGTMDDGETKPTGEVMRFDGVSARAVAGSIPIVNGPAVSEDGTTIYYVDTLARLIWRGDITASGTIARPVVFVEITDGFPDGVTIDAEGGVWVGLWSGFGLLRYDAKGVITHRIALPCANVTKVAFGGPGHRTGFVTTARVGLSGEEQTAQELAGALFAFESPVPGLPGPRAR